VPATEIKAVKFGMITEHAYDDEELKGYPQGEPLDSIFAITIISMHKPFHLWV